MFPGNDIVSSLIAVQMGGTGGISSDMIEIFLKQPVMFSVNLNDGFSVKVVEAPDGALTDWNCTLSNYKANDGKYYSYQTQYEHKRYYLAGVFQGDMLLWIKRADIVMKKESRTYYSIANGSAPESKAQKNYEWKYTSLIPEIASVTVKYNSADVYISVPCTYTGHCDEWFSNGKYAGERNYEWDETLSVDITPPSSDVWTNLGDGLLYYANKFNQMLLDERYSQ